MTQLSKMISSAAGWISAWNSRDMKTLMQHYAEDVIFSSPAAARRSGIPDGQLLGKKNLEHHFKKAFAEFPDMKLTYTNLLIGNTGVLLIYQRETGALSADYVLFDQEGKVKEVRVFNEKTT